MKNDRVIIGRPELILFALFILCLAGMFYDIHGLGMLCLGLVTFVWGLIVFYHRLVRKHQ